MTKIRTILVSAAAGVGALSVAGAAMAQASTYINDQNGNFVFGGTLAQLANGFSVVTTGPSGPVLTAATLYGSSKAQLTYGFTVGIPANTYFILYPLTSASIPLNITYSSTTSVSPGGFAQARTDLLIGSAIQNIAFDAVSDCESEFSSCLPGVSVTTSFDFNVAYDDADNHIHGSGPGIINMTAYTQGHAFAQLDPIITIDQQFLQDHPGWTITMDTVNGAAGIPTLSAGVPEPATWGLMTLGLLGAGAALRRRKGAAVA